MGNSKGKVGFTSFTLSGLVICTSLYCYQKQIKAIWILKRVQGTFEKVSRFFINLRAKVGLLREIDSGMTPLLLKVMPCNGPVVGVL